jgi:2,4-dienoyl-CoA reductase-like NADH-dependent reductase (Old Yellow Enzyme family)
MSIDHPVFTPAKIGPITLPNRVIKAGTFEGMTPQGIPNQDLIEHHRALAAGGVGMTTVAYCSVSQDGLTFADQIHMRDEAKPGLIKLVRLLCRKKSYRM